MNNSEVLDGLVGQILDVSTICMILGESLNDPHILVWSSDPMLMAEGVQVPVKTGVFFPASLLQSSGHTWGSLLLFTVTSAAAVKLMKPFREERSKETSKKVLQQYWH